jgi:EmrB/QacA subfamily drug resistance transporter
MLTQRVTREDAFMEPRAEVTYGTPAARWILLATVLGSGMAFLDSTVVNVALPAIGEDLGVGLSTLQWTVSGYLLTLAALILLAGSLSDRYGRRRVFIFGVIWFSLASLLCGLAPNAPTLVAARVLQGIGGALLTPGSLAIIQASFRPQDRSRAIGAWSGLGGVAAAIGPFLGGWLVQTVSWRLVFLINVPIAIVIILVSLRHIPESSDPEATGRMDWTGAVAGVVALAGITYALIEGPARGLTSPAVLLATIVGVGALIAFLVAEMRVDKPMMPPDIFRSRQFTGANLVTFTVYAALSGTFFFLIVQLQQVVGYTPLQAGAAEIPVTVLMMLLSPRAGALSNRIGPRIPMTVGPLIIALGMLMMVRIGPGATYLVDVLPAVVVFGLGLSLMVAPLTATVLAAVQTHRAGIASGVNNAVARAAGLLAVAVLPVLAGLSGDDYRDPVAFNAGFRIAMTISAILTAAGGITAWLLIRNELPADMVAAPADEISAEECQVCPGDVPIVVNVREEPGEPVGSAP